MCDTHQDVLCARCIDDGDGDGGCGDFEDGDEADRTVFAVIDYVLAITRLTGSFDPQAATSNAKNPSTS